MRRGREQVIWDFVQEWLHKAEEDLRVAEHLLDLPQGDYFATSFHAQQAAEKFLKAFLVRHQIPFPKTHRIEELLELAAQADGGVKQELASAAILTPFGVEFRYPGEEVADLQTARETVREARRVQAGIRHRLQRYLAQGRPAESGT